VSNDDTRRVLLSGNEALAEGAVQAGCDAYFGYPITPQNEVPEYMARRMPELGRVFVQSESELAAISMVMGAAVTGARAMTSSSSPGISLMQEGISYLCGCELPAVIANVVRGGPGLGNIGPAQSDYYQSVKGGGHGDYNMCVLAPASVQEMFDLTFLAFDIAFRYRNPVLILSDGLIGQLMEPVELRAPAHLARTDTSFDASAWALTGADDRPPRSIKSLLLGDNVLEDHNRDLQAKFARMRANEVRVDLQDCADADYLFVAYGTCARLCHGAAQQLRADGMRVGLVRPITLWPFPDAALQTAAAHCRHMMVVELSCGQMLDDVRLAVGSACPVSFNGRTGGSVMTVEDLVAAARAAFR
jgi:2-oxoglutarate ferredoxin oxidoreductase subunit alpha